MPFFLKQELWNFQSSTTVYHPSPKHRKLVLMYFTFKFMFFDRSKIESCPLGKYRVFVAYSRKILKHISGTCFRVENGKNLNSPCTHKLRTQLRKSKTLAALILVRVANTLMFWLEKNWRLSVELSRMPNSNSREP